MCSGSRADGGAQSKCQHAQRGAGAIDVLADLVRQLLEQHAVVPVILEVGDLLAGDLAVDPLEQQLLGRAMVATVLEVRDDLELRNDGPDPAHGLWWWWWWWLVRRRWIAGEEARPRDEVKSVRIRDQRERAHDALSGMESGLTIKKGRPHPTPRWDSHAEDELLVAVVDVAGPDVDEFDAVVGHELERAREVLELHNLGLGGDLLLPGELLINAALEAADQQLAVLQVILERRDGPRLIRAALRGVDAQQ